MFSASKISYFLLLVIALPVVLNIDLILDLWLVNVPLYTNIFTQLILGFFLIESLSSPLWMFVQATGKIKHYQIIMGTLIFLNFPLIYLALKLNFPVYYVWVIRIIVNILVFLVRCIYMQTKYHFPIKQYFLKVIVPVITVTIVTIPFSLLVKNLIVGYWIRFIISCFFSIGFTLLIIYRLGLNSKEKSFVLETIRKRIR